MSYDIAVIGAGIVGLATAYKIKVKYPSYKIVIIEKEAEPAKHQTGNNSGVIHSGIYYKPGSLKAVNCRRGYKYLIDFCRENEIKFDLCGKLIVAVNEAELPALENIYNRGIENGLTGLKKLDKTGIKKIEPEVNGIAGVLVPQTGIINYTDVCKKLTELLLNFGCEVNFGETVTRIYEKTDFACVVTNKKSYEATKVITCGGLHSDKLAKMTIPDLPLRIIPFRGEYYKLSKEKSNLVKNLVYPVPDPAFPFLGVHFTRMIEGGTEAGPNAVLAFKREGYSKFSFNIADTMEIFAWPGFRKVMYKYWRKGLGEFYRSYNKKAFVRALQKLVPAVQADDLIAGGAGIRAQACEINGSLVDDFYITEGKRVFHVCNAPSPAATASLSVGEYIRDKIIT